MNKEILLLFAFLLMLNSFAILYPSSNPIFSTQGNMNPDTNNLQTNPGNTLLLNGAYGNLSTYDAWVSKDEGCTWQWDFGSLQTGTFGAKWYAKATAFSGYNVAFAINWYASNNADTWTSFATYTFTNGGTYGDSSSPIVSTTTGSYRYIKVNQYSTTAGAQNYASGTWVDAVYANTTTTSTTSTSTTSTSTSTTSTTIWGPWDIPYTIYTGTFYVNSTYGSLYVYPQGEFCNQNLSVSNGQNISFSTLCGDVRIQTQANTGYNFFTYWLVNDSDSPYIYPSIYSNPAHIHLTGNFTLYTYFFPLNATTSTSISTTTTTTSLLYPPGCPAWNYTNWAYRKPFSITNYYVEQFWKRVKVDLTPATFNYSHAKSDGSDIRFTNDTDKPTSFYIQKWNNTGLSQIWVVIPDIRVGGSFISMYYGNPTASNESSPLVMFLFNPAYDVFYHPLAEQTRAFVCNLTSTSTTTTATSTSSISTSAASTSLLSTTISPFNFTNYTTPISYTNLTRLAGLQDVFAFNIQIPNYWIGILLVAFGAVFMGTKDLSLSLFMTTLVSFVAYLIKDSHNQPLVSLSIVTMLSVIFLAIFLLESYLKRKGEGETHIIESI